MSVLFLANVGNHDLLLTDPSLLPPEHQKAYRERELPARRLGEIILSDPGRYAGAVTFPLIGASLRWLLEEEGVPPDDLQIHLFATDQRRPPVTPEGEWLKDTIDFAEVIRRGLMDGWLEWEMETEEGRRERRPLRLPKRQVRVHRIQYNPADYRDMLHYFSRELPRLSERAGEVERVYLEVTGGTPAMASMLLVAGVEVFGRRLHTLYVGRGADRPYRVGIGERLLRRRSFAALKEQIGLHAYAVARSALAEEGEWLLPDRERRACVDALLEYADRRLAFDFERARRAARRAVEHAPPEARSRVLGWERELQSRETADLLAELVHSMRIKYRLGEYADFLSRLFRFQEAALRYLAERVGLQYKDEEGKYVDPAWLRNVPGLEPFLREYPLEGGELRVDIPLNRISLGAIVDFFAQTDPDLRAAIGERDGLRRLSSLARLRNKGLAGHGFEGIGKEDLAKAFGEDADQIVPFVEDLYARVCGRPVPPDPYAAVNGLLQEMLTA